VAVVHTVLTAASVAQPVVRAQGPEVRQPAARTHLLQTADLAAADLDTRGLKAATVQAV